MIEEKGIVDKGSITIISHIVIRDPDTNKIILQKRDKNILEKNDDRN
jgi:hypothetical protein